MKLSQLKAYYVAKRKNENTKQNFYTYNDSMVTILDMAQDAVDTFKPYENSAQRRKDFFQFFTGLKNTIKGALFLVHYALYITLKIVALIVRTLLGFRHDYSKFPQALNEIVQEFTGALVQTIRGVTQMVTAPLTLIRIAIRNLLPQRDPRVNSPSTLSNQAEIVEKSDSSDSSDEESVDYDFTESSNTLRNNQNVVPFSNQNTLFRAGQSDSSPRFFNSNGYRVNGAASNMHYPATRREESLANFKNIFLFRRYLSDAPIESFLNDPILTALKGDDNQSTLRFK